MDPRDSDAGGQGTQPYRFDEIVVDPAAHTVLRAGAAQPLEPKAFAVLLALLRHPGELVGRDELLDQVWGHRHVTPGVLTRAIAQLRHALGDDPHGPRYIQTRHALGYCFIGHLAAPAGGSLDAAARPDTSATTTVTETSEVASTAADPVAAAAIASVPPAPPVWEPDVAVPAAVPADPPADLPGRLPRHPRIAMALGTLAAVALAVAGAWFVRDRAARPALTSVAVLPFTTLGGAPDQDYFAAGLTEEMRDALAGVKGLKVAASVPPQAGDEGLDARRWGARLGVAAILQASVRREGQHLRITAHLSDTTTGFTLWSHTYDRQLKDIFQTQTEIAGEVVQALIGALPTDDPRWRRRLAPTHNEAAFDAYLQGLQLLHHATGPEDATRAAERFGQALATDHDFAKAQAKLCRLEIWQFENARNAAAFERAMDACRRAAQMDPGLAEVKLAVGDLYRAHGDLDRALAAYRDSEQSPSTQAQAHIGMAKVYVAQGQSARAIEEFGRALELSPGDADVYAQIGYQQYAGGDIAHALESYRKVVALRPEAADGWSALGALYLEAGDSAAAAKALERAVAIKPDAASLTNLGLINYQQGDYAAAIALRRRAAALSPQDFLMWANLGEALQADPAQTAAARDAYRKAADLAVNYLKLKPDDAAGWASLGLYRAMLGDGAAARELVGRAESLTGDPGEVALINAETLAALGDLAQARLRLNRARAAGVPDLQITSNLTFRRRGLLATAAGESAPASSSSAPNPNHGHPPGE
ncbi:MAG: tetratricopeptide repeat protein [Dyella sp.]|uniref:tetratricopeptide repeat protein n=1 Tax=Dyella sp. TaxID=1869338 RepID=UPI003F800CEC